MEYFISFLEGIITFISPCLLPMLPIYISYFAGAKVGKRNTLQNAVGFIIGFTIVFMSLGLFAGSIGAVITKYGDIVNLVSGIIVIIFGLNFLGVLKISFLNSYKKLDMKPTKLNFISSILFGVIFSIGWTPCVGAFLGSALVLASQTASAMQGAIMLLCFSLGLAIPFFISALLIDSLKSTFDFIKRNYNIINKISGIILIIVGIFIATGYMSKLLSILTF